MLMYQLPRAAEYYFFMLIGQKRYSLINWTPVKSEIMISLWWNHQELMVIFEIKFVCIEFSAKAPHILSCTRVLFRDSASKFLNYVKEQKKSKESIRFFGNLMLIRVNAQVEKWGK